MATPNASLRVLETLLPVMPPKGSCCRRLKGFAVRKDGITHYGVDDDGPALARKRCTRFSVRPSYRTGMKANADESGGTGLGLGNTC